MAGREARHPHAPVPRVRLAGKLWRKLHIGVDAVTGQIVAASLTAKEVDAVAEIGALLDQVAGPVATFTADGGYDQDNVCADVAERHPDANVVVPPRTTAVPSATAETAPTQRDCHLQHIAEHGRMTWQKASGYVRRALAEAGIGRWKQVIGNGLRAQGRVPGGRGGGGCLRAQPYAGAGMPELRPHRLTPSGVGVAALRCLISTHHAGASASLGAPQRGAASGTLSCQMVEPRSRDQRPRRNVPGVVPVACRNARVRLLWSEKPQAAATSAMAAPISSRRFARSTRRRST